jgi:NAD(P)-dependent dehydrogenase (short-subunit alcohol dehydrogenase family)
MAAAVAQKGVTINCLCPGWTNTRLVDLDAIAAAANADVATIRTKIESENLQKRILEPDELGPMAVLLAAQESHGITGQVISVDGGYGV